LGVDHYDELRRQNNLDAALVYGVPGCTVAQLWGEQGSHLLIITGQLRSIKDERSRRILPEWVEAYVQDRAKSTEDLW